MTQFHNVNRRIMINKIAVVTGANKGIGFGIVRELCKRGVGTVYLTARDEARGNKAVEELKLQGYNPTFFQLDITNKDSVKRLTQHLKEKHNGLDILINNAGVASDNIFKTTYEESKRVIETNYNSNLLIQELVFPILKNNARVVNITSDCGLISNLRNQYWIDKLTSKDVRVDDIDAFIDWFLDSVKNETLNSEDFLTTNLLAYRISKIALCALTRIQQDDVTRGISVNSLHPGFVKTDMTNGAGLLTVEEASQAPVYLALDADQSLKGKYIWFDKSEKDWTDIKFYNYDEEHFKMYSENILAKENVG